VEIEVGPARLELLLDAGLYPEAVVFKCFYWYGAEYEVFIDRAADGRSLSVVLSPRKGSLMGEQVDALISRVRRDLVDFKTRDIVARETQSIRELLVAKAFASFDEFDEPPLGGVGDLGGVGPRGQKHAVT
jgi:His-Xaa-Ser system protein HxsD